MTELGWIIEGDGRRTTLLRADGWKLDRMDYTQDKGVRVRFRAPPHPGDTCPLILEVPHHQVTTIDTPTHRRWWQRTR